MGTGDLSEDYIEGLFETRDEGPEEEIEKDAPMGQDGHACMASAETSRNSFWVAPAGRLKLPGPFSTVAVVPARAVAPIRPRRQVAVLHGGPGRNRSP